MVYLPRALKTKIYPGGVTSSVAANRQQAIVSDARSGNAQPKNEESVGPAAESSGNGNLGGLLKDQS